MAVRVAEIRRTAVLIAALLVTGCAAAQPLPSWNQGQARTRILQFVQAVTDSSSREFVPPGERVAVFDNDRTLWSEQPLYVQLVFMLDQVEAAAPKHPEWKDNPAFKALTAADHEALAEMGRKPVLELLATANSGMTVEAYDRTIREWLASARHPRYQRPYTDLVYPPMLELLDCREMSQSSSTWPATTLEMDTRLGGHFRAFETLASSHCVAMRRHGMPARPPRGIAHQPG